MDAIFSLEELSRVKNWLCQNSCTSFEPLLCRVKSELFHPFEVLALHEFFSWEMMIGCLGKKVEVIWLLFEDERKYGKTQSNTWKCDCVFWGRLMMERIWWKKERLALGLGMFECTIWKCFLALLPSCWFFFWDTYISNFVSNVLVTWGETSSPQSASMNWSVVFKSVSSASVFVKRYFWSRMN